jgi:imidazoleglycerol-phosphate dehydratase/histidinol-phosphatase
MSRRCVFVELNGGLLERAPAGSPAVPGGDIESRGPESPATGSPATVRLQADCVAALTRFRDAGYTLVLLCDPADPPPAFAFGEALDGFVEALLRSQGIATEAMLRCEHADGGCDCALPGIGLVADRIADAGLDRARSVVVGDREATLALARAMGLAGFVLDARTSWTDVAHTAIDLPRRAKVTRKTRETDITVEVDLDTTANAEITTGIGFFDHMLEQLGKHGGFALKVSCRGDLEVDEHHTIEDVALALGQALAEALGDKRGIGRYGFVLPMDEAEAKVAIDLSGRAYAVFEGEFPRATVGGLPTELVGHFFRSLSETLKAAVHVSVTGDNAHHMVEACFKGVARALRQALARSGSELPSTKGSL